MQSRSQPFEVGGLRGIVYDFDAAGDGIPMHAHTEETCHITVVARGEVRIHGDGWSQNYASGAVVSFKPGQQHEIVALVAGARVINMMTFKGA